MPSLIIPRIPVLARASRRCLTQHEANLPLIASSTSAPLPLPLRRSATSFIPPTPILASSSIPNVVLGASRFLSSSSSSASPAYRGLCGKSVLFSSSIQSLLLPPAGARGFRVSPPSAAYPMVLVVAAKQAAKIVGILTARFFRNRYRASSDESKAKFWQRVRKHGWLFWVLFSALAAWGTVYLVTHIERTPYTKRLRHLALTNSQSLELAEMELANQMAEHSPNFLPHDSRVYRQVRNVFDNVMKGNSDLPALADVEWKLHVVDRKDIQNAFVLATGDVFFCTGLLKMLQSDDDIACILGHEMAHRVLRHDVEKASRGHLLDILFIFLGSLLWLILPSDLISFVIQSISEKVLTIIWELPYSRMMEEEADFVGLDLAAKACYDVRVSSNLWSMMYLSSKLTPGGIADNPYQKFFSTHPLDKERADKLDSQIPSALQKRKSCSCPPLPHVDPRVNYRITKMLVDSLSEEELDFLRQADDDDKHNVLSDLIEKRNAEQALAEKAAIVAAEEEARELEATKRRQESEKAKAAELTKLKAEEEKNELESVPGLEKSVESGVVASSA